ncbi:hypothetical protein BMS3Abin04_01014 [bacterium BMS3Abin04]|nr:hypothetical protein BMS3Abin04_01014 [bacterium BMS3Abin04]
MKIKRFEDIIAWQKARELNINVFSIFAQHKNYGFRDQILRASLSIMNNIAEGFERQTNKEFIQFLYISKGSAAEVRSMLYLAKDFNYISENKFNELYDRVVEITKLISGFIKSL